MTERFIFDMPESDKKQEIIALIRMINIAFYDNCNTFVDYQGFFYPIYMSAMYDLENTWGFIALNLIVNDKKHFLYSFGLNWLKEEIANVKPDALQRNIDRIAMRIENKAKAKAIEILETLTQKVEFGRFELWRKNENEKECRFFGSKFIDSKKIVLCNDEGGTITFEDDNSFLQYVLEENLEIREWK